MNINSNHCNLAFDREINSCRDRLRADLFEACGYSAQVLTDRLMQRLVEISLQPYTSVVSALCKTTSNCFPTPGTKINCSRAFIEMESGGITITSKQWLANQLDFFLHWGFCLLAILAVKKASKNNLPAVLVFGVGEESLFKDGNDEQFVNYCRLGPIEPLRNGKRFLVESTSKNVSSCNLDFAYSRKPLIDLLREARLGFWGRFQLLVNHLILFFAYVSAAFRLPQLSLLGKDFAYSSISFELDERGLIESIVLTCSSFTSQPLWLRELHRSKTHMIWYSQNWKPISYVAGKLDSDLPNLRWIRVDTHWVWTHAFAEYLRTLGHSGRIEIVGPIMLYMPELSVPATDAIKVVIFDVPAVDDKVLLRLCGELTNYFHPEKLHAFTDNIISLKSELEKIFGLPVFLCLKRKRGYHTNYNRAYFDYLEKLGALGSISLASHTENLYSLISSAHLVIVYPYTSPAYVAEFLGVPCIFYDPTGSIAQHDFCDNRSMVNFANGPQSLLGAAVAALSRVFPRSQSDSGNNAITSMA